MPKSPYIYFILSIWIESLREDEAHEIQKPKSKFDHIGNYFLYRLFGNLHLVEKTFIASLAQLVEQVTLNHLVVGSSPTGGTTVIIGVKKIKSSWFYFFWQF